MGEEIQDNAMASLKYNMRKKAGSGDWERGYAMAMNYDIGYE